MGYLTPPMSNPSSRVSRPLAALAAGALALAAPLAAQTTPVEEPWYERVTIGGLLFGDAYAVVTHHDPAIDGANGFWLRRGYFTVDFAVAERWSARFRLEVNSPGDFTTNAKLAPFVKDAYLAWKRDGHELYLGISPSPTFELVEDFWGYRAVEKTPLDLYRVGNSRDFGVAYRGRAAGGAVSWHAMLGNGAGEGAETGEGKKAMLSVAVRPTTQLVAEVYGDFEDRPESADRTTFHGFVGFRGGRFRSGVEYASQDRQVAGGADQTLAVGSVFGVLDWSAKVSLLARFDRSFDGNPDAAQIPYLGLAENTEFDLALLGVDYRIDRSISLIPNVEYVAYRGTGGLPAPADDLIARLTLYVRF
jgi:hypothetical protein